MSLTTEQIIVFSVDIVNNLNQVVIDLLAEGNNNGLRDWYNQIAVPDFWVFRESLSSNEASEVIDWAEVLSGSPIGSLEQWAYDVLFSDGSIRPPLQNTREGLNQIFNGQNTTKLAILAAATRLATNAQKIEDPLFCQTATGPGGGDGSAVTAAAIANFLGLISLQDVQKAVALIP